MGLCSDIISVFRFGGLAQLVRAPASHAGGLGFESLILHHTVRTRTRFFTKKGSGTFFVYRRFCGRTTQSIKRAKAGYHYDGGILPFVLRDQVRLVRTWSPPYMAHWGQSLHTCVPGRACTPLARCNTLDFVPKSVCQGAAPLWNPCGACTHVRRKMTKFHYIGGVLSLESMVYSA